MKNLIVPVFACLLFASYAFSDAPAPVASVLVTPVSLGEVVYTVQLRKQVLTEQQQLYWNLDRIDAMTNDSMFEPLFEKVRNKEIAVCIPEYPFTRQMNPDTARSLICVPNEIQMEDPYSLELINLTVIDYKRAEDIIAVVFHEEWFYDATTFTLEKKVKGIIPIMDYGVRYDGENYSALVLPLFYIPFNSDAPLRSDFNVNTIEFDFFADSVRLYDFAFEDRFLTKRSFAAENTGDPTAELLSSLKKSCAVKETKLYSAVYPNKEITGKANRASAVKALDSSEFLRFRESWSADFQKMSFRKTVKGVYLGKREWQILEHGDIFIAESRPVFSVYLSLNGSSPVLAPVGKVHIENYSTDGLLTDLHLQSLNTIRTKDSSGLKEVLASIADRGRAGDMPVYTQLALWEYADPLDQRRIPMTRQEVIDVFTNTDTVLVENGNGDFEEKVYITEIGSDDFCGFGFFESWDYDPAMNTFTKQIKVLGLYAAQWNTVRETQGAELMFDYDVPTVSADSAFLKKHLVARNVISPGIVNFSEYYPNENDNGQLVPQYWPSCDENITNENRFLIVQQMIDQILAGKLVAWTTDSIPKPMSVVQFRAMLDSCAQLLGAHPVAGKEYYLFNEFRFDEDWYYNPQNGYFGKRVNAITFCHRNYVYFEDGMYTYDWSSGYFTIKVNGTK